MGAWMAVVSARKIEVATADGAHDGHVDFCGDGSASGDDGGGERCSRCV